MHPISDSYEGVSLEGKPSNSSANEAACYEVFVAGNPRGTEIGFTIRVCITKQCALFKHGKDADARTLLRNRAAEIAHGHIDSAQYPEDEVVNYCVTQESYPNAVLGGLS